MKKLVLLLAALLGAQTYGVYGATQARKVTVDCHLEVGVLCFDWRPNALGEALGEETAAELEGRLEEAREAWEREVLERTRRAREGGLPAFLDRLEEMGRESLQRIREAAERGLDE